MAVVLTLGPVLFADFEIPESINFGGRQALAKHKLIGGKRIIDAMGTDDDDIRWSGRFRGSDAEFRAKYLDFLKNSGQAQPLQWSSLSYTVVIEEFKANYRQPYEIDYSITCCVVSNDANPIEEVLFGVDAAIGSSVNQILQTAAILNLPDVASAVGAVQSATGSVQTFEGAASNLVSGSLTAIQAAQTAIGAATASADSGTALTLGSGSLTAQAASLMQAASLRDIAAQLGTMTKNITGAAA